MKHKKQILFTTTSLILLGTFSIVPIFITANIISAKNVINNSPRDISTMTQMSNTNIPLNEQVESELIKFKSKGTNLVKQYSVSSEKIFWDASYDFVVVNLLPDINSKSDRVTMTLDKKPINVKFNVVDDNKVTATVQKNILGSKKVNAKTGEGLDNGSKFDFRGYLNKSWLITDGELIWDNVLEASLNTKEFVYSNTPVITLSDEQNKFHENVPLSMNGTSSSEKGLRWNFDALLTSFYLADIEFIPAKYVSDYSIDKENPFFDQILYQTKKEDAIKWINFAFDVLNAEDRKLLLEGPDGVGGRDWNLADLTHESMPPLLRWNENVQLLFEMENLSDLVDLFYNWETTVASGSSWAPSIRDFVRDVINQKKFNSYEQLKAIYDKYYNLSITDPTNSSTLNDFLKAKDELIKSKNDYSPKMNKVDNYLHSNKISKPIINIGDQLPNFKPCTNFNQIWQPYKLLSYFLKGVLISNDIVADFKVDIEGGRTKTTKGQLLYSSNSNLINNSGLSTALIGTAVEEGGKIQNININNIMIQNPVTAKFLNLNSQSTDSSKFQKLNNNLTNIKIKYNPNALDLVGFNYENWTKNKDAIGLDINKYLTEIINLEDGDGTFKNDFINDDVAKMIKEVVNGDYSYLSSANELTKVPQPTWIYSGRAEYSNYKGKLLDSIMSVSQTNIDNLIDNQVLFSIEQWKKSWQIFKISLDEKDNKYPLWVPKQESGEFFVVGKIINFFTSSNYKTLKENLLKNAKVPIVLINNEDPIVNPNGDGYFLIKLKACWNTTYDTNISNLRYYEVQKTIDPKKTIRQTLEMFKKDILTAPNNKYLINNKVQKTNNSFFTNENWTENNWSLNTNLIWKDMLSTNGLLLGNEAIKKTIVNYFKTKIYNDLRPYMLTTFGQNSSELEVFDYFIDNHIAYELFNENINTPILISGIPYFFSNQLWNNLTEYTKYLELDMMVKFSQNEIDKTEATNKFNKNPFKKFLDTNDKNELRLFTNDEIIDMFTVILQTKQEIFDKASDDEYKTFLADTFNKFKSNWNNNLTGGSINMGTAGNSEIITFANWKQSITDYLSNNDPSVVYQLQCQDLFLTNYNFYLENAVNKLTFKVGNKINDNLVFSSIEEMLNDQFIKLIFKNYKVDINAAFIRQPYMVNGSVVENQYFYEINNDYNWPFTISTTYINDVKYFSLAAGKNDFTINVDLNLLQEIADINFVSNKKPIYRVRENKTELKKSLSEITNDIQKQFRDWEVESQRKDGLKSEINIGSVLLVSLLPLGVIAIGLLLWWLFKTKKRKVEF